MTTKTSSHMPKTYLYAEGEARRIAYENAQSAPGQQGTSYMVQATGTSLRYRIMFVPWILLIGLLTMGLAGVCVIVLVFLARGSIMSQTGRIISPVRLVTDAVASLPKEEFQDVSSLNDKKLEEWSKRFRLQYDPPTEDDGPKLRSVRGRVWAVNEEI